MNTTKHVIRQNIKLLLYILTGLRGIFLHKKQLIHENIALRSQVAGFMEQVANKKIQVPQPTPAFRMLWVYLSKHLPNWKDVLVIVKPETVIVWHRKSFKWFWRQKSKQRGRPCISQTTIALIKRIHKENPFLSPEKIHEQLMHLSISDAPCPNTIEKYLLIRKPPTKKQRQSWRTFLKNHRKQLWSMDFCTVVMLNFKLLYVFVILSHDRRKVEHIACTTNPNTAWVIQQLREATPYEHTPKYLIHDNDPVFRAHTTQAFL